jgi:hypothetical protein
VTKGVADTFSVCSSDFEHGADELNASRKPPGLGNPGQTARARASQQGHEHGFELVSGVVGGRNERAAVLTGESDERSVTEPASLALRVSGQGPHLNGRLGEGNSAGFGQGAGGLSVGLSLRGRADVVDDVCDDKDTGRAGKRPRQGDHEGR